ncbi:MAG: 3-oxoadipate enol-lactonase [Streptosporangiaceae bacterium]
MSDQPVRLAASVDEGPPDAPLLVLGNSLGTTRELWSPQAAVLRRHFRLVQYEHRGHGGSPAPPGPYTIAGLGTDVLRLLDDLGAARVCYCGISLGGMVGMWLAAHAPERITALAVCCTTAHFPDQAFWAGRAATVRAGGLAPLAGQVVGRWFTPAFAARDPATPARFVATLRADVDPAGYAGCCDAIAGMDLRPALPAITAPALVIAGAEDPATPPWHGAVIARGIPGARLRVVRGAAHLANVSQPGEVTALLASHLLATRAGLAGG